MVPFASAFNGVLPVLVVVFASITAPIFLNALNNRNTVKERDRQWAREDAHAKLAKQQRDADIKRQEQVAEKAQGAADLLAAATADAAGKAEAARVALIGSNETIAKVAAESAKSVDAQLAGIHRLVNSNLIAAMEAELSSTVRLSAVLKELMAVNRAAGLEPTPESLDLLQTTDARVSALDADIAERKRLSDSVDKQIAANPAKIIPPPGPAPETPKPRGPGADVGITTPEEPA